MTHSPTRKIPLTKGKFTLVDADVFERFGKLKWQLINGYAGRHGIKKSVKFCHYMHRLILNCTKGVEVDHVNGDKLDNRKSNLRVCSRSENERNKGIRRNNSSGYKGVSWNKQWKKWEAYITFNRKHIYLGRFMEAKLAARQYDIAAINYHGKYARLNLPQYA